MTQVWREPGRIEAHRLIREPKRLFQATDMVQRDELPSRTVEQVFHAGLIKDVVFGSPSEINTRIDAVFDGFRALPLFEHPIDLRTWGDFGFEANNRRSIERALLGHRHDIGREFLQSHPGRFLVRMLPFENRERRNNTHEVLYFRDSGIHRRLIERTLEYSEKGRLGAIKELQTGRLEGFVPKRWEAFVVNTIIDLVGDRCNAFAYRHEETREIDLILEWNDRTPVERWAIEVCSVKYNTHPSWYFAEECGYLGVERANCYVVRRADNCDGGALGRDGFPAISLPRMIEKLRMRIRG